MLQYTAADSQGSSTIEKQETSGISQHEGVRSESERGAAIQCDSYLSEADGISSATRSPAALLQERKLPLLLKDKGCQKR